MNARTLAAFLCLSSGLTGCIVESNHPRYPGDVRMSWSFDGATCNQMRDIQGVDIYIGGEILENDGQYPCTANGFDGIILHDFAPGTYSFDAEAVDYDGVAVYSYHGSFTVDGNVSVPINFPTGRTGATSYAYVNWLFPTEAGTGYPTCGQAGVSFVDARVDDGAWARFNCNEGSQGRNVETPELAPGQHYLEIVAIDSLERPLYYYGGGFTSQAGIPASITANTWIIGGAAVGWQLYEGSTPLSCAQAGVSEVGLNFQDIHTGEWVYGDAGQWFACNEAPAIFEFLRPGEYFVSFRASGTGGRSYASASNLAPIRVYAHDFPGVNDARPAPMYRVQ
ncbi:hypothetical protein [Corallococcus aberystwythensis]|uniref:Ig-like domain-containing protein n=1 Tax=Corallococcus aberystwythensis TaxID=2316722 RepID=A0A3A8PR23_9BACT|nr:hypothetical protein [Corallococcus aberystwythensis]RKH58906.1 hypothetical protein D7W81_28255 [Corallococcus aberystwythensis]